MFKDYYQILQIPFGSSTDQIKMAYKSQAKRWHPDLNPGIDTTTQMQDINEAYLILRDPGKRARYNEEHRSFNKFKYSRTEKQKGYKSQAKTAQKEYQQEKEYEFQDETLKGWMETARKEAIAYVKQTFREVGELSITAAKATGEAMINAVIRYTISGFVIVALMKACGAF